MKLNVPQRHSTGIQRDDHVIEPTDAARALGHQSRSERAVAVTRHLQGHRTGLGVHCLGRAAVAGIGQLPADRVALLIAQMVGQLRGQPTFEGELDRSRQQTALTGQSYLAGIDLRQQIIDCTRSPKRLCHLDRRASLNQRHIHVLACRHVLRSFR